jgi:hypothetical protein
MYTDTSSNPPTETFGAVQHTLRFDLTVKYTEEFLPTPRHRRHQTRASVSRESFFVAYASRRDAPLVMLERDKHTTYCYRRFQGRLYREHKESPYPYTRFHAVTVAMLIEHAQIHVMKAGFSLFRNREILEHHFKEYLIVENRVYQLHEEPFFQVDRANIYLEHGKPSSHRNYPEAYNVLEYAAALARVHPRHRFEASRRFAVWVIDPRAVQTPSHQEFVACYENAEVKQGLSEVTHKLNKYPDALKKRILEQLCPSSLEPLRGVLETLYRAEVELSEACCEVIALDVETTPRRDAANEACNTALWAFRDAYQTIR